MTRNEEVLSAAHMLAIGIIVVLSLSIITYPIGFLASADIGPSNTGTGSLASATSNHTELNNVADEGTGIPDGTSILQPVGDSSSNAVPSSDSGSDSSSSTSTSDSSDSSGEGSSTTSDSSSSTDSSGSTSTSEPSDSSGEDVTATSDSSTSTPAANTGIIGNDSATNEVSEGSSTADNTDVVDNQSSFVSDSGEGSPAADIGVSDQSSGSPMELQTPEANSLSTAASLTESGTAASAENPNAVVQPISTGNGQTVSLGDVSNSEGTSAKISLDKKSYAPGDTAQVTLQDPDANVDPNVVNTVVIVVGSSISDPNGTPITLTEDAPDSGKFVGTTVVPGTGNSLKLNYDSSRPQAQVVMNGVSQEGAVQVQEIPVSSFQTLGGGQPDVMIGNGIQVTLVDGAELGSNAECEQTGLSLPCGGSTNVTLSYANAPSDFNGQNPSDFTIWQYIPGIDTWKSLRDCELVKDLCAIAVHADTKTVSAISPYGPGVFVIGVDTGGGGGGGGGAGLSGAGLVLDFIAPIVASSEPPASEPPRTTPQPTTSLPDALISNVGADTTSSSSLSTTGSDNNANISSTQESGNTGVISQEIGRAAISNTGNTTIQVPGAGSVIVSFTKLSDGTLSVSAVKTPSELAALKIAKGESEQSTVMTLDNTPYSLAGTVFVIGPTDSEFKGTAMVTIPYNATLAPQASEVRMLQYTGSGWEDVTSRPPADGKVVTGSLSTLGAVAPAVKSQ